ncbi:bifunctional DNA-formamidopyrimidine glycosylase/DNA-(apurinic or apyrimidinic site) lyase [Methylosinus sp. Sm6]|uniref:bifunctional DNA-formamidopyrimidine glycosylase/DNA-(apurinic or apyrimidinic site) lyase n=1 Tax=Methylosinus sp. Sm6 TaxID=2866948 RepID=UPI001C997C1D|nr:bifunctional DNA-formamidopyrimidine glycosylase/DNA-(apurinic or apyrimidinic site) lyase [Methylosinus sp. Sm6]MBY6243180.1 bifunctional DNA-formamidopyrimidine glycosylase/DNA-(apurinic or apyrimidinic site) lyase [Methylosinus sp. Sm6]
MPELPEVETVRRGLEPVFTGSPIERVELRRGDLRFPFPQSFAARLEGRRVAALGRRAKYLVGALDDETALVMHLGMSGSFRIDAFDPEGVFHRARDTKAAHDHVVFDFASGARVTYNDPRRFGFMLLVPFAELPAHPLFAGLGVEPLGPELTPERLAAALAGRKAPLKAALLDQRIIAGLGNIYVCEALHRAHLSPLRAAGALIDAKGRPKRGLIDLVGAIREVLREAIEAGGSSLRDHRQTDGSLGYFQHSFRVYDREDAPCPTPGCRGQVSRVAQSGRSTFFCRECQK